MTEMVKKEIVIIAFFDDIDDAETFASTMEGEEVTIASYDQKWYVYTWDFIKVKQYVFLNRNIPIGHVIE